MIKFDILNRFSCAVQFTAEIDCAEDADRSTKLGLSIKWAIDAGADLAGANLAGANLAGAYLARANLAGAYLARANLAGANLAGANLAGADLARANLAGAYLAGAYLAGAYLARANLAGAYLAGANLADANLAGAYLARANLAGAYLAGAYLARANLADADLADANLARADDIIGLGFPNGWAAWSYRAKNGSQRVRVGCRDMTMDEGRAYWTGKEDRREVVAALDYAEQIGQLRGWDKAPEQISTQKELEAAKETAT